jgi:hypothetical protein
VSTACDRPSQRCFESGHLVRSANEAREATSAGAFERRTKSPHSLELEDVHRLVHPLHSEPSEIVEAEVSGDERRRGFGEIYLARLGKGKVVPYLPILEPWRSYFAELRPVAKFCDECALPVVSAPRPRSTDPRAYTPKHLAEKILTSRSALEGERKQVTVLFADLKGSMDLGKKVDPEEWYRIMNRFFQIPTACTVSRGRSTSSPAARAAPFFCFCSDGCFVSTCSGTPSRRPEGGGSPGENGHFEAGSIWSDC